MIIYSFFSFSGNLETLCVEFYLILFKKKTLEFYIYSLFMNYMCTLSSYTLKGDHRNSKPLLSNEYIMNIRFLLFFVITYKRIIVFDSVDKNINE